MDGRSGGVGGCVIGGGRAQNKRVTVGCGVHGRGGSLTRILFLWIAAILAAPSIHRCLLVSLPFNHHPHLHAGIIHSEMPKVTDGILHGFQLWINLPKKDKMCKPRCDRV